MNDNECCHDRNPDSMLEDTPLPKLQLVCYYINYKHYQCVVIEQEGSHHGEEEHSNRNHGRYQPA